MICILIKLINVFKMSSTNSSEQALVNVSMLPNNFPSLCVPRMFPNITKDRITQVFGDLDIGIIDHIDMLQKTTPTGEKFQRVFVHFSQWKNNPQAIKARARVLEGKEIKIIYDDPWFWKVSANRAVVPNIVNNNSNNNVNMQQKPRAFMDLDNNNNNNNNNNRNNNNNNKRQAVVNRGIVKKQPATATATASPVKKVSAKETGEIKTFVESIAQLSLQNPPVEEQKKEVETLYTPTSPTSPPPQTPSATAYGVPSLTDAFGYGSLQKDVIVDTDAINFGTPILVKPKAKKLVLVVDQNKIEKI